MTERLVRAREVGAGRFFRKRTGEQLYIRISKASVRFMGLNRDKVYGVAFNGNTATMDSDKYVIEVDLKMMIWKSEDAITQLEFCAPAPVVDDEEDDDDDTR